MASAGHFRRQAVQPNCADYQGFLDDLIELETIETNQGTPRRNHRYSGERRIRQDNPQNSQTDQKGSKETAVLIHAPAS